jgi:hypothetical protein
MNNEEDVKQELIIINNKLDRILELMETNSEKMNTHIDFIETIYTKVKSPFGYLMESVNKIIKPEDVKNNILHK